MKFRYLKKWKNKDELGDLVYLAQLLEELLFDFSLDTYKPSAMNTSLLCLEALRTLSDIKKDVIQKPNLFHITNELSENLKRDSVAKSLITLNIDKIISVIKNKTAPINEIKVILELMWSEINLSDYKKKNEELLIDAIVNDKGKDCVRSLIRSYVTTLINFGFSSKYLYDTTMSFFYYSKEPIEKKDDIKDYLSLFKPEKNNYIAVYRASNIFESIKDSCEQMEISVSKTIEEHSKTLISKGLVLKNDTEIYVTVNKIQALDYYSAREHSDRRMELVGTLLTLFHHKEHPKWFIDCVVINKDNGDSKKVSKSINPMHKCIDLKSKKASKRLNDLINNFSMDHQSLPKFFRSAELHSLALNSESKENQMINLWIALESLIPAKGEKAKIESLTNSIMPFLNLNYVNRLLDRLLSDLYNWDNRIFRSYLKEIPGNNLREKLMKLLVLNEHEAKRNELKTKFRDFHLLRNRFHYLSTTLKTPKKVKKLIDAHSKRVEWQVRRIYRARNSIVHTGRTPSYTSILIENIHDYLDVVMSTLVNLASEGVKIDSIEQGFMYIDLNYEAYISAITEKDAEFSNENIDAYMFKYTI